MSDENTFGNLIREYAEAGQIDNIVNLCESMKSQRDRAERMVEHLTHMTAKLRESFANITEPATGRKVTDPVPAPATRASKGAPAPAKSRQPKPPPKSKPGLDTSDFTF
jgi:uncharacterized coiled-coil protein SlyX